MERVTAEDLTVVFEDQRTHLRAVAYRMLGSVHEADDAVQEAWLRLARADVSGVDNLPAWLTTVVSRICLDHLRSRGSRREEALPDHIDAQGAEIADADPVQEALLADKVGAALQVVLDTLSPGERLAFVLHDLFALSFDEVGSVMGRTPAAVRQLASRGRRRMQENDDEAVVTPAERRTQAAVVEAFLAASRGGDLGALVALLDPAAVMRADGVAVQMGSPAAVHGADEVAGTFSGRARGARPTLLDGYAALSWSMQDELKVVFAFTLSTDDRIVEIELIADPEILAGLDLQPVQERGNTVQV